MTTNSLTDNKYNFKTKDLEFAKDKTLNSSLGMTGKNNNINFKNFQDKEENNDENDNMINENDNNVNYNEFDNNENYNNKNNDEDINGNDNNNNSKRISERSQDEEIQEFINPIAEIAEKTKQSHFNETKISNVNTKLINGELKVQVKAAEKLLLPKGMIKSCEFFLKLSLEGANDEVGLDSKRAEASQDGKITFNWAARIPILRKTLQEVCNYFKLEVFLTSAENDLPSVKLGETLIYWTFTLHPNNHNKFALNDKFDIISSSGMFYLILLIFKR